MTADSITDVETLDWMVFANLVIKFGDHILAHASADDVHTIGEYGRCLLENQSVDIDGQQQFVVALLRTLPRLFTDVTRHIDPHSPLLDKFERHVASYVYQRDGCR